MTRSTFSVSHRKHQDTQPRQRPDWPSNGQALAAIFLRNDSVWELSTDLGNENGAGGARRRAPRHQAFLNDRSSLRVRWGNQAVLIKRTPGSRSSGRTGSQTPEPQLQSEAKTAIERLCLDEISSVVSTSRPSGQRPPWLRPGAVAEGAGAERVERILRAP